MKCSFCGSEIKPDESFCPQCGASQGNAEPIPQPSPYYREVIPSERSMSVSPEKPVASVIPPVSEELVPIQVSAKELSDIMNNSGIFAILAFILGLTGLLLSIIPGCYLPLNILGIYLAKQSMKSGSHKLAKPALILNIASLVINGLVTLIAILLVILFFLGKGN